MNILIGKVGKSVKFKNLDIMHGDDAPAVFFSTMSRMLPEHNFYILGPSDFSRLSQEERDYIFPNKNVFSVYQKPYKVGEPDLISFESIIDHIKDIGLHIDFGLFFVGICGTTCLDKCIKKQGSDEYARTLLALKRYVGPYVRVVDTLGIPFYTIAEDARYVTINTKELFNRERIVFTQCTDRIISPRVKHITSFEDHTIVSSSKVQCKYSGVEKIFMMALDKNWKDRIDVERKLNNTANPKCIVLSNGHGTAKLNCGSVQHDARLDEYKKYILDGLKGTPFADTKIYGAWSNNIYDEYPSIQNKAIINLSDEIADAKYTLVHSIVPGFVTVKPYEMIILGLIPFLHPDYDKDNLLHLPEYIYTKSPEDFVSKMNELEQNPEMYKQVLNECLECIKPEYLDGDYLINNIMGMIASDLGFDYEHHDGVEPILNHFGKQVIPDASKQQKIF